MPQDFVKVAGVRELVPGGKKLVFLGDQRVLLVNVEGRYYAVEEVCSHALAFLSKGQLYGDEVVCPLHGSAFSVTTGQVLTPPSDQNLTVYTVKVEGEDVLIGPTQSK